MCIAHAFSHDRIFDKPLILEDFTSLFGLRIVDSEIIGEATDDRRSDDDLARDR